jgi:hypothetical protein
MSDVTFKEELTPPRKITNVPNLRNIKARAEAKNFNISDNINRHII